MLNRIPAFTIAASLLCSAGTLASATPVTTGSLVRDMVDMHRLARLPAPFYYTVQYSSYDHRSTLPGGPHWFDNSDGFGSEPVPNFEEVVKEPGPDGVGTYLICDIEGPGAMVRTWTAAIAGNLRITLDGADEPLYDGKAQDFLLQPYRPFAEAVGFENEQLAGTFYQRNAAYCPIPFARRCRIEYTGKIKEIHFYQIQFRRYLDTDVTTFTPQDLTTYAEDIRRTARILNSPNEQWPYAENARPNRNKATVAPGQTETILTLEGPKAVEKLTLRLDAEHLDKALRQSVLHIVCDDYPHGQVQSPVGDFFGAAPGINPYDSAPFTVEPDGTMTCRYVMPFEKSWKLNIENKGDQPVAVDAEALAVDHEWDPQRSMHFRARWRVDHDLIASGQNVYDLPYLMARGSGRFVGAACFLLNPNNIPTSGGNWWGEGDEKIFVDDDTQPSTFGTGSEDYYNYAWSSPDIFLFPYCGQPRNDGPANRGFVTNFRYHILDDLPFRDFFAFYMELFQHDRTPDFSYARIAWHYARPGLIDDHVPITGEDVRHLTLPADWQPVARAGAANSKFYQAEDILTGDEADTSLVEDPLWSGGKLLVWKPKAEGEQLAFKVPVTKDGRRRFILLLRWNPEGGKVGILLDNEPAGFGGEENTTETFVPHRTLARVSRGPDVNIDKGDHTLTLVYRGAAEGKDKGEIGIDFIWVQRP